MEDLIFNLCEGVEVRATETTVEQYRRENQAAIQKRQVRNNEEDRRLREAAGTSDARDGVNDKQTNDPNDQSVDAQWKPRRMSNGKESDLDETPGPSGQRERNNTIGFGGLFGYTPGDLNDAQTTGGGAQVLPVPVDAAPIPMSAGRMMEAGHGRHAHHGGWDDDLDPQKRARREQDIANACGVDMLKLGRTRAAQEALTSVFC